MRHPVRWLAAVLAGAAIVAACLGGGDTVETEVEPLRIFGPYRDEDANRFVESLRPFTERTGVEIRYTGTADFVNDLLARVQPGGDVPDVAMTPQPGVVRQLVDQDLLVELSPSTIEALDTYHTDADRALGEYDGVRYGVPYRVDVKSLVWYRPDVFAEFEWPIPQTLDELNLLVTRIQRDGTMSPWCLTLQAGSATGWPATDWVEDLVLRRAGPEPYDQWAAGELGFASSPIRDAFLEFQELVLAPGRLFGGTTYAISNPTTDIFEGLLGVSPGCAMAKQADFAAGWLPDGTTIGPDGEVNWFVLPGEESGPPPLVVGGDLAVQLTDRPVVSDLLTFLASPESGTAWARAGGFISPSPEFDPDHYPSDDVRAIAEVITSADALAFDASDQMPSAVGTSLYWANITRWIAGGSYDDLAATLDAAFEAQLDATRLPAP